MQAMNENKYFSVLNLSEEACLEIETRLAPCSKCRFQSECMRCSSMKAMSYWVRKEASQAGMCFACWFWLKSRQTGSRPLTLNKDKC